MAARTRQVITATADGAGGAVFEFEPPPPGTVVVGSIAIPGAPIGSTSQLVIGPGGVGIPWGAWQGNATFGPVQAFGTEALVITAAGLVAGADYEAVFIGYAEGEGPETTIIYPSAIATAVASEVAPVPVPATEPDTLWLPADAFGPIIGAPVLGVIAVGLIPAYLFDAAVQEMVGTSFRAPIGWLTFAIDVYWSNTTAVAGDVQWGSRVRGGMADGIVLPSMNAGLSIVTDAAPIVVGELQITRTHNGVPVAPGDNALAAPIAITRRGNQVSDTLPNDAAMFGAMLTKVS